MSIAIESPEIQLQKLRERLRSMTDEQPRASCSCAGQGSFTTPTLGALKPRTCLRMSHENASTNWPSWNVPNADTRHYQPAQPDGEAALNTELENWKSIRVIEDLFASAPEVGRAITGKPAAEAAATLRKENERRLAQLNAKFAPNDRRRPKQGWDQTAINKQVRSLLKSK